jgi:hypothetical protein
VFRSIVPGVETYGMSSETGRRCLAAEVDVIHLLQTPPHAGRGRGKQVLRFYRLRRWKPRLNTRRAGFSGARLPDPGGAFRLLLCGRRAGTGLVRRGTLEIQPLTVEWGCLRGWVYSLRRRKSCASHGKLGFEVAPAPH